MLDNCINYISKKMINLDCWYVAAGGCTGSVFDLYLGGKIPRDEPARNDMLGEEARLNDPEYSVMAYCAWRLDGPVGPITGWLDPCEVEGPMVKGLNKLVSEKLISIIIYKHGCDVELWFTGGKVLKIFSDATKETAERSSNWYLYGPDGLILASKKGDLIINPNWEEKGSGTDR